MLCGVNSNSPELEFRFDNSWLNVDIALLQAVCVASWALKTQL